MQVAPTQMETMVAVVDDTRIETGAEAETMVDPNIIRPTSERRQTSRDTRLK
jgi:hypothetical protein